MDKPRLPGRPAGQSLSDRPTRMAVEILGNAHRGRTCSIEAVDVIAALMEDGFEYSAILTEYDKLPPDSEWCYGYLRGRLACYIDVNEPLAERGDRVVFKDVGEGPSEGTVEQDVVMPTDKRVYVRIGDITTWVLPTSIDRFEEVTK